MKVALLTLGCKANQAEFDEIESMLKARGHQIVGLEDAPAFCLINTCSVTAKSDYQSRQLIRRAARAGAEVLVTGCYSELNPSAVKGIEGVKEIIKNAEKQNIIGHINTTVSSNASHNPSKSSKSRYFLKIQDGCDHACSYCLIPRARGRARSFGPAELITKIRLAENAGYSEAVLTGIHIGLYGVDFKGKYRLTELVREILEKTEIKRIRLSSLEVNEITPALIDIMKTGRLCPHLHIPLQSGDDRVLSLMKRPYSVARFREKVEMVLSRVPLIGLGTDVIVGFPGEGEREFENTRRLLEELPFTYMHVFPYSERPGTMAVELLPKVGQKEKKDRAAVLRQLSLAKRRDFIKRLKNVDLDVLFERRTPSGYTGTASNYIKVFTPFKGELPLKCLVNVRILGQIGELALANPITWY